MTAEIIPFPGYCPECDTRRPAGATEGAVFFVTCPLISRSSPIKVRVVRILIMVLCGVITAKSTQSTAMKLNGFLVVTGAGDAQNV
jgi:hypothetical protein